MKRLEYYSFFATTQDEVDKTLDALGKDGWEAFAIVPNGDTVVVYLKREIDNAKFTVR